MASTTEFPALEFSQAIGQVFGVLGRQNYSAIAAATGIHRHKIRQIVDGQNVSLKLSQIRALDAYLSQYGIDLLIKRTVLDNMADGRQTICVLPGYPSGTQAGWSTSSPWDVLAMAAIRELLNRKRMRGKFDVTYVDEHVQRISDLRDSAEPANLIVIGSPRASRLSNTLLCSLFFGDGEREASRLPFRFAWGTPQHEADSPFRLDADDLSDAALRGDVASGTARAFTCHGVEYPVRRGPSQGDVSYNSYGIAAAQWRGADVGTWLCCAGIDGPATEAVCLALENLAGFVIPSAESDSPSPVVWYAVECRVSNPASSRGDQRAIVEQRVISGPNIWRG